MPRRGNRPGPIALLAWMKLRAREPSTWVGLAMIAVAMGSDPMQAQGIAQAVSLIVGGGLVAADQKRETGGGR